MGAFRWIGVLAISFVAGCQTWVPEKWATLDEAYPPGDNLRSLAQIPSDSQQRAVFAASFEDVYRSALVSLSQAQFNVAREDKRNGILAGTRIVEVRPGPGIDIVIPTERRYFVALVVMERAPKQTEVVALAKAQGKCVLVSGGNVVRMGIGGDMESNCAAYAKLHWASGNSSPSQEFNNLMVFIRNNLVAAGVL